MTRKLTIAPALTLLILSVLAAAEPDPNQTVPQGLWTGTPITLELDRAPLADILLMIQRISGFEFELETDVAWRTVTTKVEKVPWDQVLAQIIKVHGLEMTREGKTIIIRDPLTPKTAPGQALRQVVLETRIYEGKRNGSGGSDILPVGGPMLVIDSVWVEDWLQQERMIQDTFSLSSVDLVSAPKIIVEPGETGTISVGSQDDPLYEFTVTAWPDESGGSKVRIRSEFTYKRVPFSETEVIATAGKPYLMGGREDSTGKYLFLSVLPRLDGNRVVSLSGEAVRVGAEGVVQPERIRYVAPTYPRELLKEGISGLVVLDLFLDTTGQVQDMLVLSADNMRLAEPAKQAVAQWAYKPARKDGKAVPAWMVVKVQFRLE